MDTNKRAFNKVSDAANKERRKQIELRQEQRKEVKVELTIASDIRNASQKAMGHIAAMEGMLLKMGEHNKQFDEWGNTADRLQKQADNVAKTSEKFSMDIANLLEAADKAANELGVTPSSIDGYNEADKMYRMLEDKASDLKLYNWKG